MKKLYNSILVSLLGLGLTVGSIGYDLNKKDILEGDVLVISESTDEATEPEVTIEETSHDLVATSLSEMSPLEIPNDRMLTEEEIELIALVTMGEAEGESEYGLRLVIDVILNRVERDEFPDTVEGVIYAPEQFAVMWNGRLDDCYVMEELCTLVREELLFRTNPEVLYFRTKHYFNWAEPVLHEGCHYFSK